MSATTDKSSKARKALNELQEKLFDVSAMLRCLSVALEGGGQDDFARAARALGSQLSAVAIDFDEVPV